MKIIEEISWPTAFKLKKGIKTKHLFSKPVNIADTIVFYTDLDTEDVEKIDEKTIRTVQYLSISKNGNQLSYNMLNQTLDNVFLIKMAKEIGFNGLTELNNYILKEFPNQEELYLSLF